MHNVHECCIKVFEGETNFNIQQQVSETDEAGTYLLYLYSGWWRNMNVQH